MKQSLKFSLLALTVLSTSVFARERLVDGLQPESIIASVEMVGRPGYETQAALVRNEDEPSLLIVETRGAANYLVFDNAKLNLSVKNPGSTNAKLSVNAAGSLVVSSDNSNFPSRDRWSRKYTIAYRDGQYVLAGFTLDYNDTLDGRNDQVCDYNLLTGKGVLNGREVRVLTQPADVAMLEDSEKLYTCKGW